MEKLERGIEMHKLFVSMMAVLAIAAAGGCNNAKSPETVASDVETAQSKAASEVAEAKQDAAKHADAAETNVDDKTNDLNKVNTKGDYDVAMAKADGDHKIDTEKCNSMAGDAQKACKDQADAKYDLAKANAKATMAAQKP